MAEHEGEEFEGAPVAGDVAFRFSDGAEEPAEVEPVGPDRDVDLVAREEGDGGADAVDGGTVVEVAFEVEAESLLRAAADGDDDVLRTEAVEAFEQRGVGDGSAAVDGRHVDVVFGDGDSLPCKPCEIAFCADGASHDPEGVAGVADIGFEEEFAQVLEAGEALDGRRLQTVPDEDHVGGVGDGQVGVKERFAVVEVVVEFFERGRRGNDEKAAAAHEGDGCLCGAVEEVNAEDAVGLYRRFVNHVGSYFFTLRTMASRSSC